MTDNICITDKLLGKGGFGSIYLGNDQNNKSYAIKCCDVSKEIGIRYLLEPIIMCTISHPYINNCTKVFVSEQKLYMIQELAKTDLSRYTRCYKNNYRPSIQQLKFWCYCLVKAVSVLHNNNIIHADIKASNILLYFDDSVKLTDFNLSVLKSNKDARYMHKVCTSTHRPLEVLKKESWNESVDIWSLGCTFYEIAYGILLFPCQNNGTKSYINAILEWDILKSEKNDISKIILQNNIENSSFLRIIESMDTNSKTNSDNSLKLSDGNNMYPIEYNSPTFRDENKDFSKLIFNDLLYKMLVIDQYKRSDIKEISHHPFIYDLPGTNSHIKYQLIKCAQCKMSEYEQNVILSYINNLTQDDNVINLSLKIYSQLNFIINYTQELQAITCTLIASKLLHKEIPKIENDILPSIIDIESNICNNLTFHFNW